MKKDTEETITALRKKTGDESPLGDSVNLSEIGVALAERFEQAAYPINERNGQWQQAPRPRPGRRSIEAPAYVTAEFFKALTEYLNTLSPQVLKGLSAYCHGEVPYAQVDEQVRADLGFGLAASPILKTTIAASIEEERAVVSQPEEAQNRFAQLLQTLTPKLMSRDSLSMGGH